MAQKHDGGLMDGSNILSVCPATMHKVVQSWLNAELASPVTVKSVKHTGTTDRFEIAFETYSARSEGHS